MVPTKPPLEETVGKSKIPSRMLLSALQFKKTFNNGNEIFLCILNKIQEKQLLQSAENEKISDPELHALLEEY